MTGQLNDDSLTVEIGEDGAIVVHGDIDMAGGPLLEAAILQREDGGEEAGDGQEAGDARAVVIDLHDVSFIDSSGLRALLGASRRARARGGDVTLRKVGPEVARLLEITGTTSQFEIESHRG